MVFRKKKIKRSRTMPFKDFLESKGYTLSLELYEKLRESVQKFEESKALDEFKYILISDIIIR